MNFADAMSKSELSTNWGKTENGAVVRTTTSSALLDLFAVAGALRGRSEDDIISMYKAAYAEDKTLAIRMLFYIRNCRNGLGERNTFRVLLRWMAYHHPSVVIKNLDNIVYFGRWDDLYTLVATPCNHEMWDFVRAQWIEDAINYENGKPISIMAKWLKSVNASNPMTCAYGRRTARELGLSAKEYRQALSKFRAHLNVCEKRMSAKEWEKIVYSEVPSYAMKRYRSAFARNDNERFWSYKVELEKKISDGTISSKDIKSTVMYPMDIVKAYIQKASLTYHDFVGEYEVAAADTILEAQWKALPNYVEGENNVLVMADVSGSMMINNREPMSASIGLATYFAERNHGVFKDKYMSFSSNSSFIELNPNWALRTKINKVLNTDVGYSTNLERAFMIVLQTAIDNRVAPGDMPKAIIVISDMEINDYCRGLGLDFLEEMSSRFTALGYEPLKVIFWNVQAKENLYLATATNPYAKFVSGFSASTFKDILLTLDETPYDTMVKVLMGETYDRVVV